MDSDYSPSDHRYWASETPERIADAVRFRFSDYQERIRTNGRLEMWRTADLCYHGRNPDGGYANAHRITFAGKSGEVAQLHMGHFRQIVESQLTIATEQRPAIECTATSNDPEAVSETVVARQVLEYDLDEGELEDHFHKAHELALVTSEGYIVQDWDFNSGELAGVQEIPPEVVDASTEGIPGAEGDDGKEQAATAGIEMPVREGEVRTRVRHPVDVARDLDRDETAASPWYIVRFRVHRWELAARFPEDAEKRDAILDAPGAPSDEHGLWRNEDKGGEDSDYVSLLVLYHPASDALSQGRIVECLQSGGKFLFDDPYPYDHMVVHSDIPSSELRKAHGYGASWDMLAPSQALDSVESGILNVADARALVRWKARKGESVTPKTLDEGMSIYEYDHQNDPNSRGPELMDRPEVEQSDFALAEHYERVLQKLSGISGTIRGEAESEIKSGADRALVATMAVRANSKHQRALAKLMRSVLNARVKLYKLFAHNERMIELSGRDKSGHIASFSSQTLSRVRRVRVELGPADLRTVEGKIAIADKMLEMYGPMVITPDRYMMLRNVGRLDDLDDNIAEHKTHARRENDAVAQNKPITAMLFHHHACHIREHVRKLLDLELAPPSDGVMQQITVLLEHITEHDTQWQGAPLGLLKATGQEPHPMAAMGPPMEGAPPANDNMPAPPMPANDNLGKPVPGGEPPIDAGPNGPNLPQMPNVAGTNQAFAPEQAPPGAG